MLLGPATVLGLLELADSQSYWRAEYERRHNWIQPEVFEAHRRESLNLQRRINNSNASGFPPAAEAMIDGAVAEQVRFEKENEKLKAAL